MTTQDSADAMTNRIAVEQRLESFGWGILLIVIGTIWLLPEGSVPHGSWLIAAGLILLWLNVARYFSGMTPSGFSSVIGILAVVAGFGAYFEVEVPLLPIALIVIGMWHLGSLAFRRYSGLATNRSCC